MVQLVILISLIKFSKKIRKKFKKYILFLNIFIWLYTRWCYEITNLNNWILDAISKKLKEVEGELEALTKQTNALCSSDESRKTEENKENKKGENTDEENDELDEEKNINVRIGDEDDEEINNSISKTSPNDTKASNDLEEEDNIDEEHAKVDTC